MSANTEFNRNITLDVDDKNSLIAVWAEMTERVNKKQFSKIYEIAKAYTNLMERLGRKYGFYPGKLQFIDLIYDGVITVMAKDTRDKMQPDTAKRIQRRKNRRRLVPA